MSAPYVSNAIDVYLFATTASSADNWLPMRLSCFSVKSSSILLDNCTEMADMAFDNIVETIHTVVIYAKSSRYPLVMTSAFNDISPSVEL